MHTTACKRLFSLGCAAHTDGAVLQATGPLFQRYAVDIYDAGHSHLYAVTWPMLGGNATQKNYKSPMGTVYSECRAHLSSFLKVPKKPLRSHGGQRRRARHWPQHDVREAPR